MSPSELSGKVQTVLGPMDPSGLGVTLIHEHLLIDMGCYFQMPEEGSERAWVDAPVTMDRLGGLARRRWNLDKGRLLDERAAIEEVLDYKYAGGNSLVDVTSIGIARDPLALARISRATGLNVIMGSSYYVPASYPRDMDDRSEGSIAEQIIGDITVGVGETGIRSGLIGEVGNFWPMTDNERKVLRASAIAQSETGATILIHPGFHVDSPPAILEVLAEAGAEPGRVIMGHLDVFNDDGLLRDLARSGCYLEFDTFGSEDTSFVSGAGKQIDILSDAQRIEKVEMLISEGHGDQIVMAQDVCTKRHYRRYGGKGYAHILENIVPRMRRRGFAEQQINAMLVENPARAVTFL